MHAPRPGSKTDVAQVIGSNHTSTADVISSNTATMRGAQRSLADNFRSARMPRAHNTNDDPIMIVMTLTETNSNGPLIGHALPGRLQTPKAMCSPAVAIGGTNAAAIAAPLEVRQEELFQDGKSFRPCHHNPC